MTVQPIDPAREEDGPVAAPAAPGRAAGNTADAAGTADTPGADRAKDRDGFLARLRSDPVHAEAMRRLADR
ncbi:hypothetical protein [Kitasatospora phosalacinea]|uniref:Uncharacterized protein n=1 Tax=Kitasatospora phosalacinea TaxID=2065 RepID=A0A9W6PF98_9ACTN|nr:hypothetical protein [Kitasatospora phosalacinea]GLW53806.1 hypothetical protein Kpho01_18170 [Kitasatospora phosalacinea]